MFGVMIFLTIFTQIVQQMLPDFVAQRTMYEARERPSKTYSWKAFLVSTILVEAAWNSVGQSPFHMSDQVLTESS
jgi:ABC-type multidrug transport system permease subunit